MKPCTDWNISNKSSKFPKSETTEHYNHATNSIHTTENGKGFHLYTANNQLNHYPVLSLTLTSLILESNTKAPIKRFVTLFIHFFVLEFIPAKCSMQITSSMKVRSICTLKIFTIWNFHRCQTRNEHIAQTMSGDI